MSLINEGTILIPQAEWLRRTSGGALGVRGDDLKQIDRFLKRFERATTPYGKNFEAREIRIALDNYMRKNPAWEASERNKDRAFSLLLGTLNTLKVQGPFAAGRDVEMATNLRMGVLHFLAQLDPTVASADFKNTVKDGMKADKDIKKALDDASASKAAPAAAAAASTTSGNAGFIREVMAEVVKYLREIAGVVEGALATARDAVENWLKEVLQEILGALAHDLTAVASVIKNLGKAAIAAKGVYSSRHLAEGVLSGHPRLVIESVREQIKDYGYDGILEAAKTALIAGLNVAVPLAGTICSVLAAVYKFVTTCWARIKERVKLGKLIEQAQDHLKTRLYNDANSFQIWFLQALDDMPLLSSYCMRLPMTGGYYGFLTMVAIDGSDMNYSMLERNYGEFNDVKKWAKRFIQNSKIELRSDDPLVSMSIKAAKGELSLPNRALQTKQMADQVKLAVNVVQGAASHIGVRLAA